MTSAEHQVIRRPSFILAALIFVLAGGCASSEYGDAEYNVEAREEMQNMTCPKHTTAACIQRIGEPTRCFCSSRDDLERLLEPPIDDY